MSSREIFAGKARVLLPDDGVLRVYFESGAEVDDADAREILKAGRELLEGRRAPILTDISEIKSITRQARGRFESEEAERNCSASGVVVSSPISRAIGNFFLGISKNKFEVKLFKTREDALDWLLGRGGSEASGSEAMLGPRGSSPR